MVNVQKEKDHSVVWIMNEHGVKSSKEAWLAKWLLKRNPEWNYCDEEDVPEQKQYPVGLGQLTETGRNRRENAEATTKPEAPKVKTGELSMKDLRSKAKEEGVNSFGKSKAALKELLGL